MNEFDVTIDGEAQKVTDPPTVHTLAAKWAAGGWPCRVDESGRSLTADFSAPSAGPPPWYIYRIASKSATAVLTTGTGGATRWRF